MVPLIFDVLRFFQTIWHAFNKRVIDLEKDLEKELDEYLFRSEEDDGMSPYSGRTFR
jgi:hypothetical protein